MNKPLAKRLLKDMTPEQVEVIREDIKRDEYRYDGDIALAHDVQQSVVSFIREQEGLKPMSPYRKRQGDIMKHLKTNPGDTNTQISVLYRCSGATVAKYRKMLGVPSARRGIQQPSEATIKARELLTANPLITDLEVSRASGISFAHVARQRDLLGIPRSARNNRRSSQRVVFDYTEVDADLRAGDLSLVIIASRHAIPMNWVRRRCEEIGVKRRRPLSPDERSQVEEMLKSPLPRMTCRQIAEAIGCSVTTVDKIRKEIGLRRLPPGHPKWEERRKARELLSADNRKPLAEIARESGLSLTTVMKIKNDLAGEKWGV